MSYLKDPETKGTQQDVLAERKERFAGLNNFIMAHGGWVTSLPGDKEVTVETLPGSALPDTLTKLGYKLMPEPDGQRILANAIMQKFTHDGDGALVAMTEGSTKKPASVVTHAGIVRTMRHSFMLP